MRTTSIQNCLKIPTYTATIVLCATALEPQAFGQGCVQSRGAGIGMLLNGEDTYLQAGQWQATLGYRWLYSDRHFVGAVEQPQRQARGDEVINDSHFFDLTATYAVTKRLSLNLTIPFVYSDRSSKYEHLGNNPSTNPRFHSEAGGLADIRLTSSFWLFDPEKHHDGNFALGVGIKAPTGDAEATDTFQRTAGPTQRYVDQSIQPGDGGWGAIIEAQGFQKLFKDTYAYMQGSYLINPEERNDATGFSTPDSYLVRLGLSYNLWAAKGLSLSLGGRMEGVPAEDWIGSSEGGRRPGYSISIEPGIVWTHKKLAITVTAPVAIERNRERSVSDLRSGGHGDAAFADYIITSSISYRF